MAKRSLDYRNGSGNVGVTFISGRPVPTSTREDDRDNIGKTPNGEDIELGIRGYIDASRIPEGSVTGRTNDAYFKKYTTICQKTGDFAGLQQLIDSGQGSNPVVHQPFIPSDLYQGASQVSSCTAPPPKDKNPSCGGAYVNYHRPFFSAPSSDYHPDVVAVTGNTTAVFGGGIVRTVVNGTTGARMRTLLTFNYTDTNVPCGHDYVGRWSLVDANPDPAPGTRHLLGYYVARTSPPAGSRSGTAGGC